MELSCHSFLSEPVASAEDLLSWLTAKAEEEEIEEQTARMAASTASAGEKSALIIFCESKNEKWQIISGHVLKTILELLTDLISVRAVKASSELALLLASVLILLPFTPLTFSRTGWLGYVSQYEEKGVDSSSFWLSNVFSQRPTDVELRHIFKGGRWPKYWSCFARSEQPASQPPRWQ